MLSLGASQQDHDGGFASVEAPDNADGGAARHGEAVGHGGPAAADGKLFVLSDVLQ